MNFAICYENILLMKRCVRFNEIQIENLTRPAISRVYTMSVSRVFFNDRPVSREAVVLYHEIFFATSKPFGVFGGDGVETRNLPKWYVAAVHGSKHLGGKREHALMSVRCKRRRRQQQQQQLSSVFRRLRRVCMCVSVLSRLEWPWACFGRTCARVCV